MQAFKTDYGTKEEALSELFEATAADMTPDDRDWRYAVFEVQLSKKRKGTVYRVATAFYTGEYWTLGDSPSGPPAKGGKKPVSRACPWTIIAWDSRIQAVNTTGQPIRDSESAVRFAERIIEIWREEYVAALRKAIRAPSAGNLDAVAVIERRYPEWLISGANKKEVLKKLRKMAEEGE